MKSWVTPRNAVLVALIGIMVLLPVYAAATGNTFTMTLFTRIIILAIAAVSLNLIMGFGGMVSFGHAAFLGIGGGAGGLPAHEGDTNGVLQKPPPLGGSGPCAPCVRARWLRAPPAL